MFFSRLHLQFHWHTLLCNSVRNLLCVSVYISCFGCHKKDSLLVMDPPKESKPPKTSRPPEQSKLPWIAKESVKPAKESKPANEVKGSKPSKDSIKPYREPKAANEAKASKPSKELIRPSRESKPANEAKASKPSTESIKSSRESKPANDAKSPKPSTESIKSSRESKPANDAKSPKPSKELINPSKESKPSKVSKVAKQSKLSEESIKPSKPSEELIKPPKESKPSRKSKKPSSESKPSDEPKPSQESKPSKKNRRRLYQLGVRPYPELYIPDFPADHVFEDDQVLPRDNFVPYVPPVEEVYVPLSDDLKEDIISQVEKGTANVAKTITKMDRVMDENIPHEKNLPPKTRCWNKQHHMADEFKDEHFRARFMIKTYLIMTIYLIPSIVWTPIMINVRPVHTMLMRSWYLYLAISFTMWVGLVCTGWKIRNYRISVVLVICRSISLANTVAGISLATELVVAATAFDAEHVTTYPEEIKYKPRRTTTTEAEYDENSEMYLPEVPFYTKYIFTDVYVWTVALFLIFITQITTIIILHVFKQSPDGLWIYAVGGAYVIPCIVGSILLVVFMDFGRGPYVWDVTQIFLATILAEIQAIVVPLRWRRLFAGRSRETDPEDYFSVAFFFTV